MILFSFHGEMTPPSQKRLMDQQSLIWAKKDTVIIIRHFNKQHGGLVETIFPETSENTNKDSTGFYTE